MTGDIQEDIVGELENAIEAELPVSFVYQPSEMDVDEALAADLARRMVSPYEVGESTTGKILLTCWNHAGEHPQRFDVSRILEIRSEAGREDYIHPVAA